MMLVKASDDNLPLETDFKRQKTETNKQPKPQTDKIKLI
jgi:hypothetical protein